MVDGRMMCLRDGRVVRDVRDVRDGALQYCKCYFLHVGLGSDVQRSIVSADEVLLFWCALDRTAGSAGI